MEYSLTAGETKTDLCENGLNPYSNGILSDNLSESCLQLLLLNLLLLLLALRQRVNPF